MLGTVVSMQISCVETVLSRLYLYLTDMGKMAGGELTSRMLDKASFWQPSAVLWRGNCDFWKGNQVSTQHTEQPEGSHKRVTACFMPENILTFHQCGLESGWQCLQLPIGT